MNSSFGFSACGKFINLSEKHSRARFALINHAINNPGIIPYENAVKIVSEVSNEDANHVLNTLVENNIIGLNSLGNVEYLYPVSCVETGHRIVLEDGRMFFAMCAIDSLGSAATFQMKAEIFSFCKDSGESVHAVVGAEGIIEVTPPNMFLSYYDRWNDSEESYNY